MRFYGWTWSELMQTPIFGFWVCYRQMNRIVAQENLRQMNIVGLPNASEDWRREWADNQLEAIGEVVKATRAPEVKRDPDAGEKLKQLAKVKKKK
jgi:hypothetical protein